MSKKESTASLNKALTSYEGKRTALISAAALESSGAPLNVLHEFPSFHSYEKSGISLVLGFDAPSLWSKETEEAVFLLTKTNMKEIYDSSPGGKWAWKDRKKRDELSEKDMRYIIARHKASSALAGILAFKFLKDDEYDVLYIFEIQVDSSCARKGLGRFMILLSFLIAGKQQMQKVILTVLKNNLEAISFYKEKMRFDVDESSPGEEDRMPYEILSKTIDARAVADIKEWQREIKAKRLPAKDPIALAGERIAAKAAAQAAAVKPSAAISTESSANTAASAQASGEQGPSSPSSSSSNSSCSSTNSSSTAASAVTASFAAATDVVTSISALSVSGNNAEKSGSTSSGTASS